MTGIVGGKRKTTPMQQSVALPTAPPPVPTVEDAASVVQAGTDEARRRRGSLATILSGAGGVQESTVTKKTLLGV